LSEDSQAWATSRVIAGLFKNGGRVYVDEIGKDRPKPIRVRGFGSLPEGWRDVPVHLVPPTHYSWRQMIRTAQQAARTWLLERSRTVVEFDGDGVPCTPSVFELDSDWTTAK